MSFRKIINQNQAGPPFAITEFKVLRKQISMIFHLPVSLIKSSLYAFLFLLVVLENLKHYMKTQKLIKGQEMEWKCCVPHKASSHSATILASFFLPILPQLVTAFQS